MTVWPEPQHEPISWETFLDIDEDIRRDLELVDGYVIPREPRGREHQKVGARLSNALEAAAVEQMRRSGRAECYETNTEVDVLLWEVPPTARKPDVVLNRCIPEFEQLRAGDVVVVVEVLSSWSGRRDRVYKMSDYADARIPHYWLVTFDKVGALTIERYALMGRDGVYTPVGSSHRDAGPVALSLTSPFPIDIGWADLEIAPQI
jgi:Uma2 family endonuclease